MRDNRWTPYSCTAVQVREWADKVIRSRRQAIRLHQGTRRQRFDALHQLAEDGPVPESLPLLEPRKSAIIKNGELMHLDSVSAEDRDELKKVIIRKLVIHHLYEDRVSTAIHLLNRADSIEPGKQI